jgi:hypothetical protein
VSVRACGHHTGGDLVLPRLPPLPASGRHFSLNEELHKVKLDALQTRVTEVVVLPAKGAGPRAMYVALGGTLPAPAPPAAAEEPPAV